MDNKNEVKEKVKKVLWKMVQIPTIICVLAVSWFICYYAKTFYKTNTLVFGIQDTKILLGISIAAFWSTWFSIGLMIEMNKKNDVIIDLLQQVKVNTEEKNNEVITKTNSIEAKVDEIIEQNDYIVERGEEQYDQLVRFHKNNRQIFMGRNDDIA